MLHTVAFQNLFYCIEMNILYRALLLFASAAILVHCQGGGGGGGGIR